MGMGQTKILSHLKNVFSTLTFCCWLPFGLASKKNSFSHDFFTHCEISNMFFSRSGMKNKNPSRMTFLAAVISETRIFLRLALD